MLRSGIPAASLQGLTEPRGPQPGHKGSQPATPAGGRTSEAAFLGGGGGGAEHQHRHNGGCGRRSLRPLRSAAQRAAGAVGTFGELPKGSPHLIPRGASGRAGHARPREPPPRPRCLPQTQPLGDCLAHDRRRPPDGEAAASVACQERGTRGTRSRRPPGQSFTPRRRSRPCRGWPAFCRRRGSGVLPAEPSSRGFGRRPLTCSPKSMAMLVMPSGTRKRTSGQ